MFLFILDGVIRFILLWERIQYHDRIMVRYRSKDWKMENRRWTPSAVAAAET